jgi:hypothetical protein
MGVEKMFTITGATIAVAACLGVTALTRQAIPASAQTRQLALVSQSGPGDSDPEGNIARNLVRELNDPVTGDRWLLLRDFANPGGPGRWVLSSRGASSAGVRNSGIVTGALLPVIRPGDRLIVEQDSALIHARLEAVALGSAMPGAVVNVRLQIGGKVFRAVALGPGRAALEPEAGVEP